MKYRPYFAPAFLVALGLVLRFAVLFAGPWEHVVRAVQPDSSRYIFLADNIRQHGSFGLAKEEPIPAWEGLFRLRQANGTLPAPDEHGLYPEVLRTPGYPLCIATMQTITGDLRAILVVQCLLGAFSAAAVRRLGLNLGVSPRAAFAAGLIWAVHPGLIVRDCVFMTESLFNVLGLFSVFFASSGRGWKSWLGAGALLGFDGLVRPVAMAFLPAVLFLAFRTSKRRFLAVAVTLAVALLPPLGWSMRNAAVGNGFRVSTAGELTLYYYFVASVRAEERGEDMYVVWPKLVEQLLSELQAKVRPGDDVYAVMQHDAVQELQSKPTAAGKVLLKSQARLWVAHSVDDLYELFGEKYQSTNLVSRYVFGDKVDAPDPGFAAVAAPAAWSGLNVLLIGAMLVGIVRALRNREWRLLIPLLLTIALFSAATLSQGMERFRSPFLFAVLLLAGRALGGTKPVEKV